MTDWLQKRLAVLMGAMLCGGALVSNVGAQAQGSGGTPIRNAIGIKTPRVSLTRDQAARNFMALLQFFDTEARPYSRINVNAAMLSSFSLKASPKSVVRLRSATTCRGDWMDCHSFQSPRQVVALREVTETTGLALKVKMKLGKD